MQRHRGAGQRNARKPPEEDVRKTSGVTARGGDYGQATESETNIHLALLNTMRSPVLTATLTFFLSLGTTLAGDPSEPKASVELLEAVAASPVVLSDVLRPTRRSNYRVLRLRFALDTDGQLVGQVLLRVTEKGQESFHEWGGPVYSAGWVPRQRVLVGKAELAEAARLWALEPARSVLWGAVARAVEVKGPGRLADIVLSAVPSTRGGRKAVDLLVGLDGQTRGLTFDPSSRKFTPKSVAEPERVPVDVRSLPELEVPEGRWFNTEKPPTLAALRGNPVLVLVTTSDCDE